MIFKYCVKTFDSEGNVTELTEYDRMILMHDIVIDQIAKNGYKPIALAYKDIPMEDYLKQSSALHFVKDSAKVDVTENEFTLLAILGINDEIRTEVKSDIADCKQGGISLRLITSENIWTARAVALELGIISKHESLEQFVCWEGKEFMDYVAGLKTTKNQFDD